MSLSVIALVASALFTAAPAQAQQLDGEYLYQVTTLRADAGKLSALLDWVARMKASDYYDAAGDRPPFVMRHSQGDQWDLMLIAPMESWTGHHSRSRTKRREKARALRR